jgi:hypothetical protein
LRELLLTGSAWWVVPISLLVFGATFGLLPGVILRLLVLLYPKSDPRRRELFAELYAPEMGRLERFEWVFMQLETALRDGLASRRDVRRARRQLPATGYVLTSSRFVQVIDGQGYLHFRAPLPIDQTKIGKDGVLLDTRRHRLRRGAAKGVRIRMKGGRLIIDGTGFSVIHGDGCTIKFGGDVTYYS